MKLTERDICTKFIRPAIQKAGWDIQTQVREDVSFTKARIIVRGKLHSRGEQKRADYILYYKSNKCIKPSLNRNEAYQLVIAIPPHTEQNRTVTKVEALMALCDQLKTPIHQANQQQQQTIVDAFLAQAVV